ncbi:unnamed protein product [Nippostrongylus brasiliensis]|uniref:Uncharacterized protein n=1 Tax=Nippostrongylus brasiliensis TaxID=27835 RepID=A0A0N4YHL2_NIPBR|nr:unnamed protein product [Nippostrongylus brasiliensis]
MRREKDLFAIVMTDVLEEVVEAKASRRLHLRHRIATI